MARTAVPIPSERGTMRRPPRAAFMKAGCPRDLHQLPTLLLVIAIALFVLGHVFVTMQVPGAASLKWAAAVFFAGFVMFRGTTWVVGRLKGLGASRPEVTDPRRHAPIK